MQNNQTKVIAIIPARYQSNRFPGKPLALIDGKPMIQHVVERAMKVKLLSRVVVATDDQRIGDCVAGFGGEYVLTRANHVTGSDRLAEAAELLGISEHDVVVNIQGDQPLFPEEVIEQVALPLVEDPALPMSTLIYKIIRPEEITDPNHVKTVFDRDNNALYFQGLRFLFSVTRKMSRHQPIISILVFMPIAKVSCFLLLHCRKVSGSALKNLNS